MPLIPCPDCGTQISSKATVCMNCGGPGRAAEHVMIAKFVSLVGALLLLGAVMVRTATVVLPDQIRQGGVDPAALAFIRDRLGPWSMLTGFLLWAAGWIGRK